MKIAARNMPTLVWRRRPESGVDAAARQGSATRRETAVPDPVVSVSTVPGPVALPVASSKHYSDGGKKEKRKSKPRAEAATAAKKKSKAKFKRDLPTGVQKLRCGKFQAQTTLGGKSRYIGSFDTPEQASAAHVSVRKDLDDANLLAIGADEVDALFDAAQKKAVEAVGGFIPKKRARTSERDLPTGVQKLPSGKFRSTILWGDKTRYIGTFDTPEQASAAYLSVQKDRDDAKLSTLGADEVDALFEAAQKKALETVGGFVTRKKRAEGDLPTGVRRSRSGRFSAEIQWGGKTLQIGTFNTPEHASAAFMSMKKDRDDIKLPPHNTEIAAKALFDAAKKKALETVGGFVSEKRFVSTWAGGSILLKKPFWPAS